MAPKPQNLRLLIRYRKQIGHKKRKHRKAETEYKHIVAKSQEPEFLPQWNAKEVQVINERRIEVVSIGYHIFDGFPVLLIGYSVKIAEKEEVGLPGFQLGQVCEAIHLDGAGGYGGHNHRSHTCEQKYDCWRY